MKLLCLLSDCQKKPIHRNARSLSVGEVGILRCLQANGGPMSSSELKNAMDISSGGVANLLNSLEKKGLVTRCINPEDRRSIIVSMSEEGARLVEERLAAAQHLTAGLLARLGKKDTEELIRIYQRMLMIAEDLMQSYEREENRQRCVEDF